MPQGHFIAHFKDQDYIIDKSDVSFYEEYGIGIHKVNFEYEYFDPNIGSFVLTKLSAMGVVNRQFKQILEPQTYYRSIIIDSHTEPITIIVEKLVSTKDSSCRYNVEYEADGFIVEKKILSTDISLDYKIEHERYYLIDDCLLEVDKVQEYQNVKRLNAKYCF